MKYTLLSNSQGRGGWNRSKMLTITKTTVTFTVLFREKYEVKKFVTLYADEDGYLCFQLSDEDKVGSFKISISKKGGAFFRLPVYLSKENRTPYGRYNVKERDGYYVTDCKLNLKKE